MVLYKYMRYDTLIACLNGRTLRFNSPGNFNDPFDCLASSEDNRPTAEAFFKIPLAFQIYHARSQIGVLSLTRNPLNLLMWAHYGENHEGGVIAIDAELAGLGCDESNLIPYQQGNVIYTSLRPSINTLNDGIPEKPDTPENIALLQKLFLYKSVHWSYEEEVRVIKLFSKEASLTYYDHKIPASAIKGVYLGANSLAHLINTDKFKADHILEHSFIIDHPNYTYYDVHLAKDTWELVKNPHVSFQADPH